MPLPARFLNYLLRRYLGVRLIPVRTFDYMRQYHRLPPGDAETSPPKRMSPPEHNLEALKDFLCENHAFLAQSRSLRWQMALSDSVVSELRDRYGEEVERPLSHVLVLYGNTKGEMAPGGAPEMYLAGQQGSGIAASPVRYVAISARPGGAG